MGSFSESSRGQSYAARSPSHPAEFELLQEKNAVMRERDAAIKEKDAANKEKDAAIKEKDAAIKEKDAATKEKDNALTDLESMTRKYNDALQGRDVARHRAQLARDLLTTKVTETRAVKQSKWELKSVTEQLRRQKKANELMSSKLVSQHVAGVVQKHHIEQHVLSIGQLAETLTSSVDFLIAGRQGQAGQTGQAGQAGQAENKAQEVRSERKIKANDKIREQRQMIKELKSQLAKKEQQLAKQEQQLAMPPPTARFQLSPAAAATKARDKMDTTSDEYIGLIFNKRRFEGALDNPEELAILPRDERLVLFKILKELGCIPTE